MRAGRVAMPGRETRNAMKMNAHERPGYWGSRTGLKYYRTAVRYARLFAPRARSVLDVGSADCEYINRLDWVPDRVRLDRRRLTPLPGVTDVRANFMRFDPDRRFDLILCLQVLEHLDEPEPFVRKLFAQGRVVIISVPYKWPLRPDSSHVQDPVDEEKFLSWTGRPWLKMKILEGRRKNDGRMVAAFRGDACSTAQSLELRWRAMR